MQIGHRPPDFSSPYGGNVGSRFKRSHAKLSWWSLWRGSRVSRLVGVVEAAPLNTLWAAGAFTILVLYGLLGVMSQQRHEEPFAS